MSKDEDKKKQEEESKIISKPQGKKKGKMSKKEETVKQEDKTEEIPKAKEMKKVQNHEELLEEMEMGVMKKAELLINLNQGFVEKEKSESKPSNKQILFNRTPS